MFEEDENVVHKAGPDGEEYCFPNTADGDPGEYGYRMGEQTTPHKGNTTSAYYITDGDVVWRCAGIMYMELPEDNEELASTLECWEEDAVLVWEDGKAVEGVDSDYNDEE
jgi:hypothetical protein